MMKNYFNSEQVEMGLLVWDRRMDQEAVCTRCGEEINMNYSQCPKCGAEQEKSPLLSLKPSSRGLLSQDSITTLAQLQEVGEQLGQADEEMKKWHNWFLQQTNLF